MKGAGHTQDEGTEGARKGRREERVEGKREGGRENTEGMESNFQFLVWHIRSLEVITPIRTTGRKLKKLKISNFSYIHLRTEITRQNLERQTDGC